MEGRERCQVGGVPTYTWERVERVKEMSGGSYGKKEKAR